MAIRMHEENNKEFFEFFAYIAIIIERENALSWFKENNIVPPEVFNKNICISCLEKLVEKKLYYLSRCLCEELRDINVIDENNKPE